MTTAAVTTRPPVPPGRYHLSGLLRAEWTKLRSVRSTIWTLLVTVVLSIGIGVLATATEASRWSHASFLDQLTFDPTSLSLTGLLFGQLAIGVLGVLVMSAEYGTGTIRSTLAAAPRRLSVLLAKATVFTVVVLVISEIVSVAAFLIGQAILTGSAPHATFGQPGVTRAVLGGGLYLALLGLFSLGLATIFRHTAGAITAFVGVLLILPLIVTALPTFLSNAISRYLPATIGATMTSVQRGFRGAPVFTPWSGFLLLCAYTALALVIGAVLLVRRDA